MKWILKVKIVAHLCNRLQEIEVTRRLLEVSQLREEQSKQIISQLESDVSKLQKLVEEEEALRRDEGF